MNNSFDDDSYFWDESLPDIDRTSQIRRISRHSVDRTRTHHVVRRDEPLESLDQPGRSRRHEVDPDEALMWVEPSSRVSTRLGALSNVDPRLLSVGAVALAAVLAVPLFGSFGADSNGDELLAVNEATTTTVAALTPDTTVAEVVITAAADPERAGQLDSEPASDPVAGSSDDGESSTAARPQALRAAPDCSNQYTVRAGDYWLSIAEASGSSLDDLYQANEASAETVMFPGSIVCLPAGASSPSGSGSGSGSGTTAPPQQCTNVYETVAGDYWLRIADAAGVDLDDLLELNDATPETALFPGSDVCLPAGASITPPTTAAPTTVAPTTEPATTAPPTTEPATTEPATTEPATTEPHGTAAPTTDSGTTLPPPPPAAPGEIEQIIRDAWPDDLEDQAVRIAWRESNFVPTARNYCCYGLFQIYYEVHASWLDDVGVHSANDLFDPRLNAAAAYALYQRSGSFDPWRMTSG